jgi:hypothetical protein
MGFLIGKKFLQYKYFSINKMTLAWNLSSLELEETHFKILQFKTQISNNIRSKV